MTSIKDVDIEDIELFLSGNGFTVPDNINDSYKLTWNLITEPIEYEFYPKNLVYWMIAYNLRMLKTKVPKYKKSEILSMTPDELIKLSRLLTLKNSNTKSILSILFYLNKLVNDVELTSLNVNMIQYLPEELIVRILSDLPVDDIQEACKTSTNINKACHSQLGLDLIRSRLGNDTLDTSDFTFDELLFYSKVISFKKHISFGNNYNTVYYLKDDKLFAFFSETLETIKIRENVNQFAIYANNSIILLTTNGELISYDIKNNKEYGVIAILDKVIGIFHISIFNVHILTAKGISYKYTNGVLQKINYPNRILQLYNNYYLSDKGEVYYGNNFNNKFSSKIKQITKNGYMLSYDNEIYYLANGVPNKLYQDVHIKEISEYSYGFETNEDLQSINRLLVLYENGDCYNIIIEHNKELGNQEIEFISDINLPKGIYEINSDGDGFCIALTSNELILSDIFSDDITIHEL